MSEALEELFLYGEEKMEKVVTQLRREFAAIRSGRTNPMILDRVMVDYYGVPTQLRQMSQVTVQDGTTLVISPYDKSVFKDIEKALIKAELGVSPNSDGIVIRLVFPALTEERRRAITKDVKKIGEETKVGIRNARRDMVDDVKKLEKSENLPEDVSKDKQEEIQKLTDKYVRIIDQVVEEKRDRGFDGLMELKLSKNVTRWVTGCVFGIPALLCLLHGGIALLLLLMLVIFLGAKEYVEILKNKGFFPSLKIILFADALFAVLSYFDRFDLVTLALTISSILAFMWVLFKGRQPYIANVATTILGFVYSGWFPLHLLFLRGLNAENYQGFLKLNIQNDGLGYVVLLFVTILFTDTGCYLIGKKFGKHKLAPVISPKKTVEGALGGAIFAVAGAFVVGYFIKLPWYHCLIAGVLATVFAQIGDLCESLIKRDAGVKDSGTLLPGHGGFLDRTDSYLLTVPVLFYYFKYFVVSNQLWVDFANFIKEFLHAFGA